VVKSGFNSPDFSHIKTVSNISFETIFGMPDWIRTSGLWSRSPTLYPTELRAHI
jgi:hypothetical protein